MPRRETKTLWIDRIHNQTISSGGQQIVTVTNTFSLDELRLAHLTLIRTIICHDYSYVVHDSGEGSQALDIGIGVRTEDAITSGNVPLPGNADDLPIRGWVYRCRHKLHGFAADQAAVDVARVYRDIRAQRRVDNGQVYIATQNTSLTGTASTVSMVGITRCLFRLG